MASNSLGTLTLDLIAKIGGFTSGLTEAERASKKSADEINKNIESIGVAGYAVGNALGGFIRDGVTAIASAFPALIEQAAKFQDIADKTGGSAEGFANFAVSAKVAGVSIESIADASVRLSKQLLQAGDDSKQITAGLKALNIPIEDFKKLQPDQQIKSVAEAFGNFADGAGKAAVAQQLFGRSGAELLKFFADYVQNGGDVKILNDQLIKQADDFADAQTRQRAQLSLIATAITASMLPAMTSFVEITKDVVKGITGIDAAADKLALSKQIENFADTATEVLSKVLSAGTYVARIFDVIGTSIGASAATAAAALNGDFKGALNIQVEGFRDFASKISHITDPTLGDQMRKSAAQNKAALADPETQRLLARARAANQKPELQATAPPKKGGGSKGSADDPTKKLLDNDLAAFKAQGDQAKELLADRNKMLDLYNQQGLLSVKDYYAALQGNLDEATAAQAKSYDDQIAALQKFRDAAKKDTEVADAQGKINKLEEDKAKLYRQSGQAALESSVKQVQAQKAVNDAFNEVNAKVLELQGNLRAAGAIRFDASNEKLLAQATAEHNEEVKSQIALLKQYMLAQADINKAQQAFSLAQGDLQIAEDRITMARERGTMGEIDSLKASGEARKQAVAVMQQQLDVLLAINEASRSPERVQQVERLKLQLDSLKATLDPLADKINTSITDSLGDAFGDFITGTKTAKQAFADFSKSVINDLARMVAKQAATDLYKAAGLSSGSSGGGLGGLFSSFFSKSGGGAASGSFTGLSADTLALGGYSAGGFTGNGAANEPAGIVHKNEYVLNAAQTRALGVANLDKGNFGGGTVVNIHQAFPPGTNRQTVDQAAKSAAVAIQRVRRNT